MNPGGLRNVPPPPGRASPFFGYLGIVVGCGSAVCVVAVLAASHRGISAPFTFGSLALLAVVADTRAFTRPGRREPPPAYPSICFTFAIMLMWGLAAAVLVQTTAVIVSSVQMRHAWWRAAFNAGQYALAFGAAATVVALGPARLLVPDSHPVWIDVLVVVCAIAVWFAVSCALVSLALRLRFGGSWSGVFATAVTGTAISTAALLLLAPVVVVAAQVSAWLVPLVLVPLYAVHRMAGLAGQQHRLANSDPLSGLANRSALERAVTDHLTVRPTGTTDGDPGSRVALLLLDIDQFRHVNDALGHGAGDRLLVAVARRLAGLSRPVDLVARLGGDEFALAMPGLADVAAARRQAGRIVAALAEPVVIDGLPLDVCGSIGVAVHPDHGHDFDTLMRNAEVAMYDAKCRGAAIAVYDRESDHHTPERLALLADLRWALGAYDAGISVYFQPQVEIATGAVVGMEALLRWHHPQRGAIDPQELIRIAEHSPVMRLLTLRVLDEVINQLARWAGAAAGVRVAVNVSVRDLHRGDIVDWIADRLAARGVRPSQLQLEITEGALMDDPGRVLATLVRLRKIGVSVALDDFGTGYSSMVHLRRLPLSEVKIDRSFVLGITTNARDAAIVRSLIDLAGALGMRVVAEGVEDERTWRMLAAAGCHLAQGWYCGRPMPADEFLPWLARHRGEWLARHRRQRPALAGTAPSTDLYHPHHP